MDDSGEVINLGKVSRPRVIDYSPAKGNSHSITFVLYRMY
jgi:hypothetical protein